MFFWVRIAWKTSLTVIVAIFILAVVLGSFSFNYPITIIAQSALGGWLLFAGYLNYAYLKDQNEASAAITCRKKKDAAIDRECVLQAQKQRSQC